MHQAQTQGSGLGGGKVQRDIDAQVAITAEFGKQAAKSWGEYANGRFANAKNEEEARCWGPDGACRAGGHALLGGLGGGVAGAAGAGLTSVAAPHVAGYLIGQGVEPSTAAALTGLLAFGAGSAAGGVAAGAGALNEAAQNNLVLINNFVNAAVQQGQRFGPGGLRLLDQASQALLRTCASSSVCMNLLPAAGVAWLAAQLTQEFEAKQPSLADQIPGYGGGYGPKPGPSHTGNDKTTNPIPGGSSTEYPAEGPKESGVVGGKPLDPQKPGDNILPGHPTDPLPDTGIILSESKESSKTPKQTLAELGYNDNGVNHIFKDKHQLDKLLAQFSSKEEALVAMQKSAQKSISAKNYHDGTWVAIKVGDTSVAVKGVFIDGKFRISTATMRPF
ncbi:hypothetical protein [Comamonas testosteroni]|uniref:hypothetical protein n=1 Tax=Comamonas testosteroni TaxID=285 RepID=UPI000761E972|nr:hypothetical protein [Comamonas testosteroni]KWT67032.1 hypothetical protein APV28_4174 [Comamonas testosteroni]